MNLAPTCYRFLKAFSLLITSDQYIDCLFKQKLQIVGRRVFLDSLTPQYCFFSGVVIARRNVCLDYISASISPALYAFLSIRV